MFTMLIRQSRTLLLALGLLGAAQVQAAALQADPYLPEPTFNNGQYFVDAFAGAFTESYAAGKVAYFGSNDYVVAGLVPAVGGGVSGNLGLVRYDGATGAREPWPSAGSPYAHFNNEYLIYPNQADHRFTAVRAVRAILNRIFVLVDRQFSSGDSDVHLIVLDLQGQILSDTRVFGSGANEYGAGVEPWLASTTDIRVNVVVTRHLDGVNQVQSRRYREQGGQLITDSLVTIYNSAPPCDTRSCMAAATVLSPGGQRIYIGGTVQLAGTDTDFLAMSIDFNGGLDGFFGNGGAKVVSFDQGPELRDWVTGIDLFEYTINGLPYRDLVLVGEVSQSCRPGIGVIKLVGQTGALVSGFGINGSGQQVVGGSELPPGFNCNQFGSADLARAVLVRPQRIVVAGYRVSPHGCFPGVVCEDLADASLAVLDRNSGALRDHRIHPFPGGGARFRHSGFWGLAASPLWGDEGYVAVGDVRWFDDDETPPSWAGKKQFATIKLSPDRIFGNGLQ